MGNIILRLIDTDTLGKHLYQRQRDEEKVFSLIKDERDRAKDKFDNFHQRIVAMEKMLEIITNESRLKIIMEKELENKNNSYSNNVSSQNHI